MGQTPIATTGSKKSTLGVIFFVFLGFFITVLMIFFGFFAYYLWAQKYAPESTQKKLSERFNPNFSKAPGLAGIPHTTTDKDIKSFIRTNNPTLGSPTAPVTILAFIDFECPYSRQAFPILENIREKYGSTVYLVFKHFPLDVIHPRARASALAAACTQKAGKFWPYYRLLFQNQDLESNALLLGATQVGINPEQFSQCLNSQSDKTEVDQDFQDGVDLGVQGTPTYFVNQRKVEGLFDEESWNQIILEELQRK